MEPLFNKNNSQLNSLLCDICRNCVKTILEHRDWKKAMRTTHPGYDLHGDVVPETPMRLLIKIYPDLAEVVFDNCVIKLKQKGPSINYVGKIVPSVGMFTT